ncbi:unnamed protein product, partial [Sphacelaria rigidula]
QRSSLLLLPWVGMLGSLPCHVSSKWSALSSPPRCHLRTFSATGTKSCKSFISTSRAKRQRMQQKNRRSNRTSLRADTNITAQTYETEEVFFYCMKYTVYLSG